jgi:hypothetical protein
MTLSMSMLRRVMRLIKAMAIGFFLRVVSCFIHPTSDVNGLDMKLLPKRKPQSLSVWMFGFAAWFLVRSLLSLWGAIIWLSGLIPKPAGDGFFFGIEPELLGWRGVFLGVWQRWDTIHYSLIARNGYSTAGLSAFFPLYPLMARFLSSFLGADDLFWLVLISNLALFLSIIWLYNIVITEFSSDVARRSVFALLLFPTAFFLSAAYPQSLALLFVLLTYFSARRRRWFIATLCGILAGLTHSTVLPLIFALVYECWIYWKSRSRAIESPVWLVPLSPALGAGLFLAWRINRGLPSYRGLLFNQWGRFTQYPWQTIMELPELIQSPYWPVSGWVNLSVVFLVILITIWEAKRIPISMMVYQLSMLWFLLSVTTDVEPLASASRYSLLMFPLFIGLAMWTDTPTRKFLAFAFGIALQLYLSGQFFLWIWVG